MKSVSDASLRRIIQMIGLLGSDLDGEVLAAARGIRRILCTEGASFGDLLFALNNRRQLAAPPFAAMAAEILADPRLRPHERQFVEGMQVAFEINPQHQMTTKQASWFAYLFAKYGAK